jgi:hypothetical protein
MLANDVRYRFVIDLASLIVARCPVRCPGDLHALPLHDRAGALAALARIRLLQGRPATGSRKTHGSPRALLRAVPRTSGRLLAVRGL